MPDHRAALFAASCAYVEAIATPRETLALAAGVSERDVDAIREAGALPAPTYVIFANAIHSPIRDLGLPPSDGGGRAFYCPAVLPHLRRAALMLAQGDDLARRLEAWLAASLTVAAREQADDAQLYAWTHLFQSDGALNDDAVQAEARQLGDDWLGGGWAVCLRRWDGRHIVTKDLERARIAALTDDGKREKLSGDERLALFDAINRLDALMLPFAPYERPHGTPGLFIDQMQTRYRLWA